MKSQLQTIREALESCAPGDWTTGYVIHPSYDEEAVGKALTALTQLEAMVGEQKPVHWRAVLDPEQAPQQLKTTMHVVGFREKKAAEGFVAEQIDFYGWRYTIEPLYAAPVAQQPTFNAQRALEAIEALLSNIRRDAPSLSGKVMGFAEEVAAALRDKVAQQPQAEPFGYVSQHTNGTWEFSPTTAGVYPDTAKSITAVYAKQPQARPDFTDEWTGYLKDGETPFERFLRERKDVQSVLKLYQRALEENERLKAQQPQAEPDDEIIKERDDAEDFIDMLLDEVLGTDRPEWTSAYGREDALRDVQERMTALHKPMVDKAWGRFEKAQQPQTEPRKADVARTCPFCNEEWVEQPQAEAVPSIDALEQEIYEHTREFVPRSVMDWMLQRYYPAAPQQAEAVPPDVEAIRKALERAFIMGQNYWADADSESYSANKRSDVTRQKFNAMRDEVCAAIAQQKGQP